MFPYMRKEDNISFKGGCVQVMYVYMAFNPVPCIWLSTLLTETTMSIISIIVTVLNLQIALTYWPQADFELQYIMSD